MHTNSLSFRYNMLAICVLGAMQPLTAFASTTSDDDTTKKAATVVLDEIVVVLDKNTQNQSTSSTVKTAKELSKQMVADSRDLVRYETGVTVVETGRFGASGYAIRGVDENRVAINIDGLRQAETLSSQGFKELFEGYGNFNNTRNSVEIENLKRATIKKGADSVASGSGALGGAVLFDTKEAQDYLNQKDWHVGYKTGYASANNQKFGSLTLAGKAGNFDALLVATRRDGHELENWGYKKVYPTQKEDLAAVGAKREKTDPYYITSKSNLLKIGFEPNDYHRIGLTFDDTSGTSRGEDLSYVLRSGGTYSERVTEGERRTYDQTSRRNVALTYTNYHATPFWDDFEVSFANQKIKNKARTDEYCFYDTCNGVRNDAGLNLANTNGVYHVVDASGGNLVGGSKDGVYGGKDAIISNSQGKVLSGFDYKEYSPDNILIDCDKLDCNNKFRVFVKKDVDGKDSYTFVDRGVTIKTDSTGRRYGHIDVMSKEVIGAFSGLPRTQKEEAFFILPRTVGYQTNQYKDRDLNTNTKQLRLNLNKQLDILNTSHKINYGVSHEKSDKRMVNQDGYEGGNVKWWADYFVCNRYINGTYPPKYEPKPDYWATSCNSPRSNTQAKDSYLIPVETKSSAFHFVDNWRLTDKIALEAQYRYDSIKLKPSYDPNVPVPKGLIAGVFVPVPDRWFGADAPCGYNTPCLNDNLAKNLAILLQDRKFRHHSYNVGLTLDPLNWLRVQGKYSNGFRAPTSDEVYMTFRHPSFSITPNISLKPEIAKTQEIATTFHHDKSFVTLGAFKTDYDDFIDLKYIEERAIDVGSVLKYPFYQNVNREKAKVTGFEVNSKLSLDLLSDKLSGFHIGYKYIYQKGRINTQEDGEIPMNAIQPPTAVYNVGYVANNDKYGVNLYATQVAAKKAKDTYNSNWKGWRDSGKMVQGRPVTDSTLAWRSGGYTVLDAIVYYKPTKNVTLSGGVFNLTNKKYITWDSARSIRGVGTINLIDQNTGAGINRFYAPERNFKVSAEFVF